jgi:hypothetical protein
LTHPQAAVLKKRENDDLKSEVVAVDPKEKSPSAEGGKTGTPEFDLTSPEWYLNRELTWLEFNRRILHEGEDERTPLLERIGGPALTHQYATSAHDNSSLDS